MIKLADAVVGPHDKSIGLLLLTHTSIIFFPINIPRHDTSSGPHAPIVLRKGPDYHKDSTTALPE
jgi:hypothetical protein